MMFGNLIAADAYQQFDCPAAEIVPGRTISGTHYTVRSKWENSGTFIDFLPQFEYSEAMLGT